MVTASVVVPTFRRTASLRRTLGSCLRQCGIDPAAFEIVVVDNCPGGSARETVAAAAAGAPVAIRYVHEPRPAVSHARHASLAAATGGLLIFLSVHEPASAPCLSPLLAIP